jgi:hypothetical protein
MDYRHNGTIVIRFIRRRISTVSCHLGRRHISAMVVWFIDYRHTGMIICRNSRHSGAIVCQWYVAVRYQRRVGSVGRSARSLVIGLVRRHISTVSCQFRFICILVRGLLGS